MKKCGMLYGEGSSLLTNFLRHTGLSNCLVLTGAGCSTESGIPDYRGPCGQYRQKNFTPVTYQNFLKKETERKRYWARSMLGFSRMSGAACNGGHLALYQLARRGVVSHVVTQNVDGLHHLAAHGGVGDRSDAGHAKYTTSPADNPLTELHGNIHQVICLQCGDVSPRCRLQQRLRAANQDLYNTYRRREEAEEGDGGRVRPDGDYHLPAEAVDAMRLVSCERCGGMLKPHVVLFGENVSTSVVRGVSERVRQASSLLCVGTSLQVFSAYRYVLLAKECGVPVGCVNSGKTRADDLLDFKADTDRLSLTLLQTLEERKEEKPLDPLS